MEPRVLILRAAGTNCDRETAFAFEQAGARAEFLHVNRLVADPGLLEGFHILALPGGFTYGDDIASGKVLANQLRLHCKEAMLKFVADGKLVIGICNGFQVLVKARFLPALAPGDTGQTCTLTSNERGKFEARWVYLETVSDKSPFVRKGDRIYVPVAHGEGKFVARDESVLDRLEENGQVVFRYTDPEGNPTQEFPWNPNGSARAIAGICDETGRILGLMPHPERHVHATHHPRFTSEGLKQEGEGMKVFRNAVEYVKTKLLAGQRA